MRLLQILLCLSITDLLLAATYAELTPALNPERLSKWERSCDNGQEHLADYLWFAYAHGYGCQTNYARAASRFQQAQDAQLPLASLFSSLSWRGRHWIDIGAGPPDKDAFQKQLRSQLETAQAAFHELMIDDPGARCWYGLALMELGEIDDSIGQLKQAAAEGYYESHAWLAYLFMHRKRNHKAAQQELQQALKHQIGWANYLMGDCANRGWGMKRNRTLALKHYTLAAELGDPRAQLRYSQFTQRSAESFQMITRTCEQRQDPELEQHRAHRLEHGRGTQTDIAAARQIHHELFERYKMHDQWQRYAIRAAYESGRIADKLAATQDHNQQHYQEAHQWYQELLRLNKNPRDYRVRQTNLALGIHFYYGRGLAQDMTQATALLKLAAEHNMSEAYVYLADAARTGRGQERNLKQAITYYDMALKKLKRRSDLYSKTHLQRARCYEELDLDKAIALYQQYSKRGNSDATWRLIEIYRLHKTRQDSIPELLSRAADQGHPQAKQEMEKHIRQRDAEILNRF